MTLNLATIVRESAFRLPDKTALAIGDVTMTYGTIDLLARRFAGVLSELGVQPGQHIALMLPNVPQFTVAYYGGHYGANPIVPLNVLLMGPEVAYHLEDSDAVVLVAWEGFYEQARAGFDRVDTCKHLLVVKADPTDRTSPEGAHNMMALIGQATPVQELPNTMPDDTAVILYTSGTTGRPKGAELTHFNLFYNADYCVTRLLGAQENDVALATL
ncbi:MAG: AMP-binding protein, partial [Myxococcota bacterium]